MLCNNFTRDRSTIELYRGDSLDVEFTVNWEDGTPVDLTGYHARFRVQDTAITKDSINPAQIIFLSPLTLGKLRVMLVPSDTATLPLNYEYTYDAELYDDSANVYTFAQGIFKVV